MDLDAMHPSTVAIHAGRGDRTPGSPLNPPLVMTSSFHVSGYSREEGSPNWAVLEDAIGALEGGSTVAFASGIGATTAIIESLPVGARVVGPSAGYAWTRTLMADRAKAGRIVLEEVNTTDTEATLEASTGADLLWLESPSNPLLEVAELDVLCKGAKEQGVLVAVDSTFATPLLQQPLKLGADFCMQSATKFIGGHSDLLLGAVSTATPEHDERLRHVRAQLGATPGTLESFLALRGLRTLPVRLDVAQRSAQIIAERLADHPAVSVVHYPGLPDDPGHARASRLMSGFGAMLSFELHAGADLADTICQQARVFTHAKSLGGVESLIDRRARYGGSSAPPSLLRLSIGCEHVEDLWADLERGLASAG